MLRTIRHRSYGGPLTMLDITTIVVPPGMRYSIDRYGLGVLESLTAPVSTHSQKIDAEALATAGGRAS